MLSYLFLFKFECFLDHFRWHGDFYQCLIMWLCRNITHSYDIFFIHIKNMISQLGYHGVVEYGLRQININVIDHLLWNQIMWYYNPKYIIPVYQKDKQRNCDDNGFLFKIAHYF